MRDPVSVRLAGSVLLPVVMPSRPRTLALSARPASYPRESPSRRGYGRAWQRTRLVKLALDPFCADCGEPATEVDHVIALARGGSHDPANLMSLCKSCHARKTCAVDGGGLKRFGIRRYRPSENRTVGPAECRET